MSQTCPTCNAVVEPHAKFCTDCGATLASRPNVVFEVEADRRHVQNHACQLRFRVTSTAAAACDVTLRMVLHGRPRHVEQDDDQIEQFCRFRDRGDQFVLSFPFRPLIPGEFPVESLRLIVSPADEPRQSQIFELPDRSLFVRAADPNQPAPGPGIAISGGINLDFSQLKEMYGADVRNLLNLNVDQKTDPDAAEPAWQAIQLRPAGTEERVRCTFAGCGRPVAVPEVFMCRRCEATVCRRHRDADKPAYCKVCAERPREEEFQRKSQPMKPPPDAAEVIEALLEITQSQPAFEGRVWTQRGTQPTTRDICTVPRSSKDCYRIGERFTLNAQAERDCHLTLLDIGTSGKVYVLLENHPLPAGALQTLSGPDESREWVIGKPAGIERIKALFTLEPLALFPGATSFTPLASQGRPGEAVAAIRAAGAKLRQMPDHCWTDAGCEFAIGD